MKKENDSLYAAIDMVAGWRGVVLDSDLKREIHFRCENLQNAIQHIEACLSYIFYNGKEAFIDEEDDGNIWEYCK